MTHLAGCEGYVCKPSLRYNSCTVCTATGQLFWTSAQLKHIYILQWDLYGACTLMELVSVDDNKSAVLAEIRPSARAESAIHNSSN